ncbi:MAG: CcmD family protein [Cyclobacteriaceae bacterium]|nr:MAG: CcmD family protein [Cyclobacteriaceae bacterium]
MRTLVYLLLLMLSVTAVQAQDFEMADVMRSNGQIYVVVAIILIVLAGLFTFLFMLERKIKRLENKVDSKK